jgi:hypothetical protein
MPVPVATSIVTTGFKLAQRAQLGKKVGRALKKGFGLLAEKAKGAKFTATEKGFSLSAPGLSAQGGQAAQGAAARVAYNVPGSTNYLPYIIGGAVLLMLLKK